MNKARFEWDPAKVRLNELKHGITFDDAVSVFLDEKAAVLSDERHTTVDERRWHRVGRADSGILLVVVFTVRSAEGDEEEIIRIISARPANRREKPLYPARQHDDA